MSVMTLLALGASALLASAKELDDPGARGSARLASFDGLQKRLGDPNLRLIDVRARADYDQSHIPGAVWVDIKAAEKLAARPGGLADSAAWEAWLAPLGIADDLEVLVYGANRQLDAARLWWLLSFLGVEKVGLIDGNFALWQQQGRPVTKQVTEIQPRPFRVTFRTSRHATRAAVLEALNKKDARIIDARTDAEHTGVEKRAKRGGRIPMACHLEWASLVDQDGRFVDESAARAKLEQLGVKPGEAVITHCQSGGRASVDAFVFERLGFPTRNYYLGWSDWGNADDTPVVTGSEAVKKP
jgi:thiosulfate/3-mercaptopyruvate sulfurtransferase